MYKNYEEFISSVEAIEGVEIQNFAQTENGLVIPLLKKGKGQVKILVVAAVHAREYITTPLVLELLKEYNPSKNVRFDVVPMLNIDGVFMSLNDESERLRKSNARGADLNCNFNALWGEGKGNRFGYASLSGDDGSGRMGACPESEAEAESVGRRIRLYDYSLVVAYHSKGEEVYYGFGADTRYKEYAERYADYLGYTLKTTPYSAGGLKDYFTLRTGRLGLTVEVGNNGLEHPI
ncbi:MAG: hypothetical protein LBN25_04030, partial [Christensenellaceae bacterium]|nr:hypothetical protein [Christensenellaceae bacterium]